MIMAMKSCDAAIIIACVATYWDLYINHSQCSVFPVSSLRKQFKKTKIMNVIIITQHTHVSAL